MPGKQPLFPSLPDFELAGNVRGRPGQQWAGRVSGLPARRWPAASNSVNGRSKVGSATNAAFRRCSRLSRSIWRKNRLFAQEPGVDASDEVVGGLPGTGSRTARTRRPRTAAGTAARAESLWCAEAQSGASSIYPAPRTVRMIGAVPSGRACGAACRYACRSRWSVRPTIVPDLLEQHGAGDDLAGMAHQELEQAILARQQIDARPP